MKYQISITVDDETVYTHTWENDRDNIVFGYTPALAALEPRTFYVLGNVMQVVGEGIVEKGYYDPEDIPTTPTTEQRDTPDYVEGRMFDDMLSKVFEQLTAAAVFTADLEATS